MNVLFTNGIRIVGKGHALSCPFLPFPEWHTNYTDLHTFG